MKLNEERMSRLAMETIKLLEQEDMPNFTHNFADLLNSSCGIHKTNRLTIAIPLFCTTKYTREGLSNIYSSKKEIIF